jgi:hypothetical protein
MSPTNTATPIPLPIPCRNVAELNAITDGDPLGGVAQRLGTAVMNALSDEGLLDEFDGLPRHPESITLTGEHLLNLIGHAVAVALIECSSTPADRMAQPNAEWGDAYGDPAINDFVCSFKESVVQWEAEA